MKALDADLVEELDLLIERVSIRPGDLGGDAA